MNQPDVFDPDALRLTDGHIRAVQNSKPKRPPRHAPGTKFLKGPIPWPWLQRASRLPGKVLAVALLLWFQAGCRNVREVRFCLAQAQELGMDRQCARRGLQALARAGLVTVRTVPGQCLQVTLLDVSTPAP
jgi:hypothetical protein